MANPLANPQLYRIHQPGASGRNRLDCYHPIDGERYVNDSSVDADDFRMTPLERSASLWLALLYGSRMLGLFLILL